MKKIPVTMSSTVQRGTRKRLRHIFFEVVVESIVCLLRFRIKSNGRCCCSGDEVGRA
jgi:hypothetical protein